MEPLSQSTLTILVLIGVILSGVAFVAVSILIICLLCMKYRRSDVVSPVDTRSVASSNSHDSRIASASSVSSVSSIPVKSPPVTSTKRQVQQQQQQQPPVRVQKYHPDIISVVDEYSSVDQKKYPSVQKRNVSDETRIRSVTQTYTQRQQAKHHSHHQQPSFELSRNLQFNERRTPYPPDVLARERVMMTYLQIPTNTGHK